MRQSLIDGDNDDDNGDGGGDDGDDDNGGSKENCRAWMSHSPTLEIRYFAADGATPTVAMHLSASFWFVLNLAGREFRGCGGTQP